MKMIEIREATKEDVSLIKLLAEEIFPVTFRSILSDDQIEYMMDMMYESSSIIKQMENGHHFAIIVDNMNRAAVGYTSYQLNYDMTNRTKIHKLYIKENYHRKGIGEKVLKFVMGVSSKFGNESLFLNVNKYNKQAINFYYKNNFKLIKKENIDIGSGYVMDDFVFELLYNL